jgi:hypothetical protein
MSLRRWRTVVVTVAAVASGLLAAAAGATGAANPNLAPLALRPADIPGSAIERSQYVREPECVKAYERELDVTGLRFGRTRLLALEHDLCLKSTVAGAKRDLAGFQLLTTKQGRKLLEAALAEELGVEGDEDVQFEVTRARKVAAGQGAVEVAFRFTTLDVSFHASMVMVRVDRVLSLVFTAAFPPGSVTTADATRLARVTAKRVTGGLVPIVITPPAITGQPLVGQTLAASVGTWRNAPTAYTLSWLRCDASGGACVTLTGAAPGTYVVAPEDLGATLRVAVVARNGAGTGTPATSPPTAVVAGVPVNTAPPTVTGTPQQGQTLTATTGTWNGSPTTFTYQWQRCDAAGTTCADVPLATAFTYPVTGADVGWRLRVAVVAQNAVGSATATSEPTAVVT